MAAWIRLYEVLAIDLVTEIHKFLGCVYCFCQEWCLSLVVIVYYSLGVQGGNKFKQYQDVKEFW